MVVFFLTLTLFAKITTLIEGKQTENQPIEGVISIEHTKPIDEESFTLDGKPLQVTLERSFQVTPPDPLKLSIYQFSLPPKKAGLYILPSVSAIVGGIKEESVPLSYAVQNVSQTESLLVLKPFVDAPLPLYPGQKAEVGYEYYFTFSIDLIEEKVPLLAAVGFKKIGGPELSEREENGVNVVRVSQVIEAQKPGTYRFGPSLIEGRPWRIGPAGQKQYAIKTVKSEVPVFEIKVAPFPSKHPASFKGAMGDYTFSTKLLTPANVKIGEKMELEVTIEGKGDLDALELPDFTCQPGVAGFFRLSDLPPTGKQIENKKIFTLDLYPLSSEVNEVPSLEFSFFDLKEQKFVILKSEAIQIDVFSEADNIVSEIPPPKVEPVFISPNVLLYAKDLRALSFGSLWAILLYPLFFILLLFQWKWKYKKPAPQKAKHYFAAFLKQTPGTHDYYCLMEEAFNLRLKEVGQQKAPQVQDLLERVSKSRFGKDQLGPTREEIIKIYKELS